MEFMCEGVFLIYFDLGGGLGVDYIGEKFVIENLINYMMCEYCINVVEMVKYVMDVVEIDYLMLVIESGCVVVVILLMFLFNVFEVIFYDVLIVFKLELDDYYLIIDLFVISEYVMVDCL